MSEAEDTKKAGLKLGLNAYVSNKEYHADKGFLSSTPLKSLVVDSMGFYNDYILGNKREQSSKAFDIGSLVHTLVLEPEKAEAEYAFYPGKRMAGQEWEEFKHANPRKVILREDQKPDCEAWAQSALSHPVAKELLHSGQPELTVTGLLDEVPVKVRTDYINIAKGIIVDIKTTGRQTHADLFRNSVDQFQYDLSAALYAAICEQEFKKKFDFYFVTISKQDNQTAVYQMSHSSMRIGQSKVNFALARYKECMASGDWTHKPWSPEPEILEIFEV